MLLQNISRDIVAPESLAEYERLQAALKRTQRAEVRYAIEHPELGRRSLLTRVEPATLASGKKTASVVTLDVTDQQRSQARSEQLLREMTTILESTTAGIAYLRGGMLVRCNRRFETMLRLPPGTSAGATLAELLARHPDAGAMATEIRDALIADATYEIEFAFGEADDGGERPLGRTAADQRWFSLSVRGVGAGSGGDEAIAVLSDVTRLKSQQAQLETLARDRESMARRTRAILDSVLVGIVIVGPAGIEWMNRSAQRMFGAELSEFLDAPIETVATAEADHPFRSNRYLDELVEGEAATFECRVRARDGREFWVVGNAVATGRDDSSRQLTYALLDIERRREAEAAVSQAQDSLRRVIGAAPLAIALLDAKTLRLVQLNEVAAQVVGETPERLIGKLPEEVFGARVGAERRHDMESALRSLEVTTREYRIERDGELQVWDARYLPLAAGRGASPDQLLLVATDVTEQRAAQEARLEAAIAQRDMLVKEVHHRIKNNLQGVAGLLQQIAKRKPEVAGPIDEVVGQVQAIAQVYGLQVGDTGPLSMVRRARGDHQLGAPHLRPADPLPRRRARRGRLDPARGRGDPGGADAERAAHQCHQARPRRRWRRRRRLRARGRGRRRAHRRAQPGAAAGGLQPRADPERRLRPRPGAGAAAAARRHACASSRPTGTSSRPSPCGAPVVTRGRRRIRFAQAAGSRRRRRRTTSSVGNKGTILVVDDNRLVLATLTDGLSQAGYRVIDADNGDDAILLAREHKPDLALLDIRMEGKSGFDVAQYLRTQCRMPFMFLSAFSDEETVAQVEALGAVAYLVKPLDIRQIVPAVEAAFAHLEAGRSEARAAPAPPRAHRLERAAAGGGRDGGGGADARHSLKRHEALERLGRLAAADGVSIDEQAELLLAAVERLADS